MKKLSGFLAAALLVISVPAQALDLEPSSFSLSIGALPPVVIPNNNASIAVTSGGGTFTEPIGVFGPTTVGIPKSLFTGVSLISGLTLAGIGNGTVVCSSTVPNLNCTGGLAGTTLVNVLQLFNLSIPLSVVGDPGASVRVDAGGIIITVVGQKWTAGPTSVTGVTGLALSNGEDNRKADHSGNLVLVTGFKAITNVAGSLPGFAVQTLNFMPEPARLLSAAAAAGAIVALVRMRRRRK